MEQMDVAGGILAEQGGCILQTHCSCLQIILCLDIGLSSMADVEQANRKATGNYISVLFAFVIVFDIYILL